MRQQSFSRLAYPPDTAAERFLLFVRKLTTWIWPSRAVHAITNHVVALDVCTWRKSDSAPNMLTNIPSFRHEQDLNPGSSRMEIYETISHVSTNQVWLHINSASSRVYFRPIALFFVGSAGAGQLARSYLCLESLSTPFPLPPLPPLSSTDAPAFPCSTTSTFSPSLFVLHLVCTL